MRRSVVLGLGAVFLLLTGLRPGTLPFIPHAPFSDAAISHWPATLYLRDSVLERGEFPVWRDVIMAGQPFAANPLNKTAYPLPWLVLFLPPTVHLDLLVVLHLALAGWGMGRWLVSLGLSKEAAGFGALAYLLAPRMIGHLGAGHLDLVYALAWWPWLMDAVRVALSRRDSWLISSLRIGLFADLLFLADVRLSLFALVLAALYAVYETRSARRLLSLLASLSLFALLTASVIVPLVLWSPYLSRAALSLDEAGVFSLQPGQLLGLLAVPTHGGNQEAVAYVGLPVLAFALIAIFRQPRRLAFWIAAVVLASIYALGTNGMLWSLLVRLIPALAWFRVPSRAWLVVAFVMPLLAAYGLDVFLTLIKQGTRKMLRRLRLLALVGLVAGLVGGAYMLPTLPALRGMGIVWLVGGAGLALVVLLSLNGKLPSERVGLLLLLVLFADLAASGSDWLSWRGPERWLDPYRPLAARLVEDAAARIYAPIFEGEDGQVIVTLPQEVASAYSLSLFGGVDPFQLRGIVDAANAAQNQNLEGYSVVIPPVAPLEAVPPDVSVLITWGVSHAIFPFEVDAVGLNFLDEIDGAYVYAVQPYVGALNQYGWPPDAPGLPDEATVRELNYTTALAALISSFGLFLVSVASLIILYLAKKRRV